MWMTRGIVSRDKGEITYDGSPRIEPKRSHHWLTNIFDPELLSAKKLAVEGTDNRPGMGIPFMNMSPWHNSPSSQSFTGQFSDHLFGPEHVQTSSFATRNITSLAGQNVGKNFEKQHNNASTIGLSMSHTVDDTTSSLNFGGIRKAKVNQVQDFNIGMHETLGLHNTEGHPRSLDIGASYSGGENNAIFLSQAFSNSNKNFISMGPFISMHQNFVDNGSRFIPMGTIYDNGNGNVLSISQPFVKDGDNHVSLAQLFQKTDSNSISMGPSFSKGQENFISMASSYGKAAENLFSMGSSSHKRDDNMLSMGPISNRARPDMPFMVYGRDIGDSIKASASQNFNNDERNTITVEGSHNGTGVVPSDNIIWNAAENFKELGHKEKDENTGAEVSPETNIAKNKEPKRTDKVSSNTFPSNVKTLLSTGIFDGVPVKYYSWSREKSLKGTIKGAGYLCSCKDCSSTKILNAFEFERHANCKTKHPNNHIYFENGKTVYGVVQELKKTPQERLFDVILNVTGSEINQKNFNTWKASYEAATQELQRIYGKDAVASST